MTKAMSSSGMKSLIITLPAKSLATGRTTPGFAKSTKQQTQQLNFTRTATSILVDKIKVETGTGARIQTASPKHMEPRLSLPIGLPAEAVLLKQEQLPVVTARGKKRRLDHLTWEEKLQRKKLKNRVAAQTSRDRKKAKLDELEESVRLLREYNEQLLEECSSLREQNESLVSEVTKLRQNEENKAESKMTQEPQVCSKCQARVDCTVPTLGSAVSPINPLQQGGTAQQARAVTQPSASVFLKILTFCLLSKICSANSKETSTSTDSKNSLKVLCERLPLKWKQALLNEMNRQQPRKELTNLALQKKWWGRHQVMWKPMHPVEA